MLPDTVTNCCPHMALLCGYATYGLRQIMHVAEIMQTDTAKLHDDLKPYGEVLTKIMMEVLIKSHAECLELIAELGIQEITRAALPPNHQTKPDLLKE
jgi:hypothetical protein